LGLVSKLAAALAVLMLGVAIIGNLGFGSSLSGFLPTITVAAHLRHSLAGSMNQGNYRLVGTIDDGGQMPSVVANQHLSWAQQAAPAPRH